MLKQFRIESAVEAALIDEQIDAAWSGHPRRFVIDSGDDFVSKLPRPQIAASAGASKVGVRRISWG